MKISRKVVFKKYPITIKMSEREYQILSHMATFDVDIPKIVSGESISALAQERWVLTQEFLNKITDHNNKENARASLP